MSAQSTRPLTRRRLIVVAGGAALGLPLRLQAQAATAPDDALQAAVRAWAAGQPVQAGRVQFDIAPLVENGNAVPIVVRVDAAPGSVREIVVFNQRNPQREVASFTLGPASGRAEVATRMRLATSQQLVALARLADGSLWSGHVDVIVTLAACIES